MAEIEDITITSGADCDSVRTVLDANLKAAGLPDVTILQDIYAGDAARYIALRFGAQFADLDTEDQKASAKSAVIYKTASKLVYALKQVTDQTLVGGQLSWKAWDYDKKKAELENRVEEIISLLLESLKPAPDPTLSDLNPHSFQTAGARRRRFW